MRRSKRGHCLLAIAAGLSAAGARAWAVDASDILVYSVGSVRVKPHLALAEEYDDNIFYRPDKPIPRFPLPRVADFLTVVSPGVNLQLGRNEANHITFDYTMDQSLYLDQTAQDHRNQSFLLNTHLAGNRIKLDGNDRVQFLSDILGGALNQGQRVDRKAFFDDYRIEYALSGKTSVYLEGALQATDYKRGTLLYDENTILGTGGFAFGIGSRVRLFGEVHYGQTATSPNDRTLPDGPHADRYGGYVGASGVFSSRLSGSLKVGYEALEFADGSRSSSSPVAEASLTQKFSDRTVASLTGSRRNSISAQVGSSAYTADAVTLQLSQVITPDGKLQAVATGSLENDQYEDTGAFASRHDLLYRAGFALNYNIRLWLKASLVYDFEKFDTNNNLVFDYDDNRVTFRVSIGY